MKELWANFGFVIVMITMTLMTTALVWLALNDKMATSYWTEPLIALAIAIGSTAASLQKLNSDEAQGFEIGFLALGVLFLLIVLTDPLVNYSWIEHNLLNWPLVFAFEAFAAAWVSSFLCVKND